MEDRFLSEFDSVHRLISDYEAHGKLIIAYDFDNTVRDYHNQGDTYPKLISIIKRAHKLGMTLVVYTANTDLDFVKDYLIEAGIPFDGINEDMVEPLIKKTGKIYYNILLDDRAGLHSAYYQLETALNIIEQKQGIRL